MRYLKQFCVIVVFAFLGELCHALIPYPIPASIYGMVLLFAALSLGSVKLEQVRQTSGFLVSCLPVLFVAPVVKLMDCWEQVRENLIPLTLIVFVTTVVTFGISGLVTQWLEDRKRGGDGDE